MKKEDMKKVDMNNSTASQEITEQADDQFTPQMEIEDADVEKISGGARPITNCKPVVT